MFTVPALLAPLAKCWSNAVKARRIHNQIASSEMYTLEDTDLTFWQLDPATAGPANRNEDDRGLVCLMKPSVFLRLSEPRDGGGIEPERVAKYKERITFSLALASPMLVLGCDPANYVPVLTADGRQRMQAILEMKGDVPVPVILRASHPRHFDSPRELLNLLHVREEGMQLIGRAVVSIGGIIQSKPDLPFIEGSLRRLRYRGDNPSYREHDDIRMGMVGGPYGPMA